MGWLLNISYLTLLLFLSPFLFYKSWRTGKYRAGWSQKFWGDLPVSPPNKRVLWIHAVSVGEVLLLKPFIKLWLENNPHDHLVLTVTTSTGHKVACQTYPEISISYAPLDFTWSVKQALINVRPNLICLVELELWPNLIRHVHRHKIPIGIINARLSEKSHRGYSYIKPLIRSLLKKLSFVLAQDDPIANRFLDLGTPPDILQITGSMKFDGVNITQNQAKISDLRTLLQLNPTDHILIAGSTHEPEEEILLQTFKHISEKFTHVKLLIAPRHAERFNEVAELIRNSGFNLLRKSQILASPQTHPTDKPTVILLDTLGELSIAWGLADLAYVGGSMGNKRGGQNMLEPAAYGAAVITGPHTWNFAEIMNQLLSVQGIIQVADQPALQQHLSELIQNPKQAKFYGQRAQELVTKHQGASLATYEHLTTFSKPVRTVINIPLD